MSNDVDKLMEPREGPTKVTGTEDAYMVGTGRFGLDPGTSYLVDSERKTLIETGTSTNVTSIVEDLSKLNVDSLDHIAVTHIHLDHAGGAGFLASEFPEAKIIVHEIGSKHLIDPSVLTKSVEKATGRFFKYYGDVKPIPEDRIKPVTGGEEIDLGSERSLQIIHTPGHAPHHVSYYDPTEELVWSGDIGGIYFPDRDGLYPTTPPPNFDLEKNIEMLEYLKNLNPRLLLYTHVGWTDGAKTHLDRYKNKLRDWVLKIERLRSDLDDEEVREYLKENYDYPLAKSETYGELAKGWLGMNVRGVIHYLNRSRNDSSD